MSCHPLSIVLIDDDEHHLRSAVRGFEMLGCQVWTARTFEMADKVLATRTPSYVVSELRVDGRWLVDYLKGGGANLPFEKLGVVTAYSSIATAVQFARLGVAAYLTKPVTPQALLDELRRGRRANTNLCAPSDPPVWPTLDRIIWEYVSQVYVSAGSISEAARRLGIFRYSLRRMLAKRPPES
jgi:ActR/RegA family two-component response regulator